MQKNLCIFNFKIESGYVILWKIYTDYFLKKNYKVFFLTEDVNSKNFLSKHLSSEVEITSINESIDIDKRYSTQEIDAISNIYSKTSLFAEKLSIVNSPNSLFLKNNDFVTLVVTHIIFFEKYFAERKINVVTSGIYDAYQSYNDSIIEKVEKITGGKLRK